MTICTAKPGDWKVKVVFKSKSALQANASGVLPVPPEDALALVTDKAGDGLFRVVQRTALPPKTEGTQLVDVVNKAALRILCWKLWTTNRVVYEISSASDAREVTSANSTTNAFCQACTGGCCCDRNIPPKRVSFELQSSNVLNSLSGTWSFEAVKIPRSSLPQASRGSHCHDNTASNLSIQCIPCKAPLRSATPAPEQQQLQQGLNMLAIDSSIADRVLSSNKERPSSVSTVEEEEEMIAGTLVRYEQLAQPKGLPPGMRFVPGLSDAVRASIGREVRQVLDKISYAADLEVRLGLTPQQALTLMTQQLEQAGGSFKQLTNNSPMLEAAPPTHNDLSAPAANVAGSNFSSNRVRSSAGSSGVHRRRMAGARNVVEAGVGRIVPQLDVQPLEVSATEASAL